MKHIILTLILLSVGIICKAQYRTYYNPYLYAAIAAETNETYKLNNIRFDENAIKQNPEAWKNYMNYLKIDADYSKKYRTYSIIGLAGVGIMLVSTIPFFNDSDSSLTLDCGLLETGMPVKIQTCLPPYHAAAFILSHFISNTHCKTPLSYRKESPPSCRTNPYGRPPGQSAAPCCRRRVFHKRSR